MLQLEHLSSNEVAEKLLKKAAAKTVNKKVNEAAAKTGKAK